MILRWLKWLIPLLSALFFTVALLWFVTHWEPGVRWRWGNTKGNDLLQHYAAGQLVREGKMSDLWHDSRLLLYMWNHPVEPLRYAPPTTAPFTFNYVYPPLVAVIASVLGRLPYETLYIVWTMIGLGVSIVALGLVHRGKIGFWEVLILGGYPPFAFSLLLGQNTLISLVVVAGTGFCLNRKKPFLAGLILSEMFYKPPILGILGLLFLIAGWYLLAAGLLLGMIAWQVLTILLCGFDSLVGWLGVMQQMLSGTHSQNYALGITWTAFFRTLGWNQPAFLISLCAVGIGVLILYALRLRWSRVTATGEEFFLLILLTLPLMPYALVHELMLAFPVFALAEKKIRSDGSGPELIALLLWWLVALVAMNLVVDTQLALAAPFLTIAAVILIWKKENRIQLT